MPKFQKPLMDFALKMGLDSLLGIVNGLNSATDFTYLNFS